VLTGLYLVLELGSDLVLWVAAAWLSPLAPLEYKIDIRVSSNKRYPVTKMAPENTSGDENYLAFVYQIRGILDKRTQIGYHIYSYSYLPKSRKGQISGLSPP
jgi:hypothetical protein